MRQFQRKKVLYKLIPAVFNINMKIKIKKSAGTSTGKYKKTVDSAGNSVILKDNRRILKDSRGKFAKGTQKPAGAGRKKGTPNKFTTLKNSFLEAFQMLGGTHGLVDFAMLHPEYKKAYYQMTSKMLPTTTNHDLTAIRKKQEQGFIKEFFGLETKPDKNARTE